ncbi:MAG TPA: hypothetical protein PKA06_00740 [Gemmatales bacterium]|nr:hypothetical protein [Gemmatales bacterium]
MLTKTFVYLGNPANLVNFSALLNNPEAVQEVAHDVLVNILKRGLGEIRNNKGRFRDYLRTSLRHAVFKYWRKQPRPSTTQSELEIVISEQAAPAEDIDRAWLKEWRECLLERTWRTFKHRQDTGKIRTGFYTVLRLAVDNPGLSSTALAARAEAELKKPIRPDAFRQMLSRARRKFAELLRDEVASTLDDPSPEALVDEFVDLGILDYMRDYIHPDFRNRLPRRR